MSVTRRPGSSLGIRAAALAAVFLVAGGQADVRGDPLEECRTTFMFCASSGWCEPGATCTIGDCSGSLECTEVPGCEDGQVAFICRMQQAT
jgi:hypothetical protein